MKKIHALIGTGLLACFGLFSFITQDNPKAEPDFVVVKLSEAVPMQTLPSNLVICYSDGRSESFPVKSLSGKNLLENNTLLASKLAMLKKAGYKISGMSGGDFSTTYLLERE